MMYTVLVWRQGKGPMKTYWIYNRWEDADEIIEPEKEELNIPGELMNYSDVRLCGANNATYIDAADAGGVSDRRTIWREEDIYVAGSGAEYQKPPLPTGGIHQC